MIAQLTDRSVDRIQSNSVISNSPLSRTESDSPLDYSRVYSVIYYELSQTRLNLTPSYLELFLAPLSSNQPRFFKTPGNCLKNLVNIFRKRQKGTSWEVYPLKAEKCVGGITERKSDWLDLPLWIQKVTICPTVCWFSESRHTLLNIWHQPLLILNPHLYLELFLDTLESFEIAGFYYTLSTHLLLKHCMHHLQWFFITFTNVWLCQGIISVIFLGEPPTILIISWRK